MAIKILIGGSVEASPKPGNKDDGSKAYEVLAPILEKYGEINLEEYSVVTRISLPVGRPEYDHN